MTTEQAMDRTAEPDVQPRRWWHRPGRVSSGRDGSLARQVVLAEEDLQWQNRPALTEVLSAREMRAERALAEWLRSADRGLRRWEFTVRQRARKRSVKTAMRIAETDAADASAASEARADARRESSADARVARLYRAKAWSMRALIVVVIGAALYSAVNVQQNLAPHGHTGDPMFWLGFILDAIITVPLIVIMRARSALPDDGGARQHTVTVEQRAVLAAEAEHRQRLRRKLSVAEWSLLTVTLGLNTFPYLSKHQAAAGVHAIAPVMIGVLMIVQDAVSALYGMYISAAVAALPDTDDGDPQYRQLATDLTTHYELGRPASRTSLTHHGRSDGRTAGTGANDPASRPSAGAGQAAHEARSEFADGPQIPASAGASVPHPSPAWSVTSDDPTRTVHAPQVPHQPVTAGAQDRVVVDAGAGSAAARSADPNAGGPAAADAAGTALVRHRIGLPAGADRTDDPQVRELPAPTPHVLRIAVLIVERGQARKEPDEVAVVLAALEAGYTPNRIQTLLGFSYRTVNRLQMLAQQVATELEPAEPDAERGEVITCDSSEPSTSSGEPA